MKPWFVYSLGAFVFWGVWGFLCKLAAIKGLNSKEIYIYSGVGYLSLIIFLMFTTNIGFSGVLWPKLIAVVAGVTGAIAVLCLYSAVAAGKLSIVLPLSALYPAVSILLAVIVLKERLSPHNIAGIILALVSIVLLTHE